MKKIRFLGALVAFALISIVATSTAAAQDAFIVEKSLAENGRDSGGGGLNKAIAVRVGDFLPYTAGTNDVAVRYHNIAGNPTSSRQYFNNQNSNDSRILEWRIIFPSNGSQPFMQMRPVGGEWYYDRYWFAVQMFGTERNAEVIWVNEPSASVMLKSWNSEIRQYEYLTVDSDHALVIVSQPGYVYEGTFDPGVSSPNESIVCLPSVLSRAFWNVLFPPTPPPLY